MLNRFFDTFMEKTERYMEKCAKSSNYNMYIEMVKDQMTWNK